MKQVQFRANGVAYNVIAETEDYYILDRRPDRPDHWAQVCRVAVCKTAVTVVEEVTYEIGQRFKVEGNLVILAQTVDSSCTLISLECGNRYTDPIKVGNCKKITQEELSKMSYNPAVLVTEDR